MRYFGSFPNRTYCDVLTEMRAILSTMVLSSNTNILLSLVEELQVYGNRMEAALEDQRDIRDLQETRSELYKEVNALKKEKDLLEPSEDNK